MRLTKLQANKLRDEGRTIEVFNHSTLGIFNVTEMRNIIAANPQIKPLNSKFADIRAEGDPNMTNKQVV